MEDRKVDIKEEAEEKEERKTDIAEAENENRKLSDGEADAVAGGIPLVRYRKETTSQSAEDYDKWMFS